MTQLTLEPHARSSDPGTSHLAAASISADKLSRSRQAVYNVLREWGPMTQAALVYRYKNPFLHPRPPQSDSGIRSRACELVRLGKVRDTGNRATLASGRKAIIWEAIP